MCEQDPVDDADALKWRTMTDQYIENILHSYRDRTYAHRYSSSTSKAWYL